MQTKLMNDFWFSTTLYKQFPFHYRINGFCAFRRTILTFKMSSNFRGSIILLIGFILTLQIRDSESSVGARDAIRTAIEVIDTTNKVLELYGILDRVVPWKKFDEDIVQLDKYIEESSKDLIGEVKTYMLNGIDAYFRSTKSIFEWCGLTNTLLPSYKRLLSGNLNQSKYTAQRALLLKVLDNGIQKMSETQATLEESSTNFNNAAGILTSLNDLSSTMGDIREFYEKMKETVNKAITDIDENKVKLKEKIRIIGDLKVRIEEMKTVSIDDVHEIRDIVTESVDNLIAKCTEYRNKHN